MGHDANQAGTLGVRKRREVRKFKAGRLRGESMEQAAPDLGLHLPSPPQLRHQPSIVSMLQQLQYPLLPNAAGAIFDRLAWRKLYLSTDEVESGLPAFHGLDGQAVIECRELSVMRDRQGKQIGVGHLS